MDGAHENLSAAAEWVARITDPGATEQDFRAWQEWLAQDPAHASAYEEMERIWALLGHLPEARSARGESEEATETRFEPVETAHAGSGKSRDRTVWQRVKYASAAAIATMAVITSVAVLRDRGADVIETSTGEQRSLRLTDGSQVVLGAETRVAIEMSKKQRSLTIDQGIAYFKVAHDTSRPFVVTGGGYSIEAVGTAFSVDTKPDRVAVIVTEGRVRVKRQARRGAHDQTRPVFVDAGERVLLGGSSDSHCVTTYDASDALGWRDGRLGYIQEELRFVISDVNRYTRRKIVFANPDIGRLEFTGTLFLEYIDEWLATLPGSFPLIVEFDGDERVVLRETAPEALTHALPDRRESAVASGC